jgi:hypothetical protein
VTASAVKNRVLPVLGAALAAALLTGATVAATPQGHAHPGRSHPGVIPGKKLHDDNIWGGYVATGTNYRTVSASWVNPKVDCSARGIASWWVGFDGWSTTTVEQIGVDADCSNGTLSYNPWWEMYPRDSQYFSEPTAVGDHMTATVTHNRGHSYTMTLADSTAGWTRSFTASLAGAGNDGAEAIVEPIGSATVPELPDFGSLSFTKVTVDHKPMGSVPTVESTIGRGSTVLATTAPLSGSTFRMTWLHN